MVSKKHRFIPWVAILASLLNACSGTGDTSNNTEKPVSGIDVIAPSKPENIRTTSLLPTTVLLSWDAATDNIQISGYRVYQNNVLLIETAATEFMDNSVAANTAYQYTVSAFDTSGNTTMSDPLSITTPAIADIVAPSAPGNLRTTGITSTSISLAWNAATDNVGVTAYRVYRGTTLVTTTSSLAYTVSLLTASTTYQFRVDAVDAATNTASSTILTTSTSSGDTTRPLVTSTTPANNATRVLTSTSQIIANFNEALAPNSVNTGSYTLSNGVTGTVSMANSNTRAIFTPASQLARGITYTATLNGVTDAAGNALQGIPYTFRFSTCGSTATSTYTVAWNAVTDLELTGYRVYYGTTTLTKNSSRQDIGRNVTSWQLNPVSLGYLPCTTVYVAVTALGSVKGESALSGQTSTSIE